MPVSKSKGVQIISEKNDGASREASDQAGANDQQVPIIEKQIEKPKYYRVKQNPEYLMAEYADRYELYRITPNGLVKVRTDYKKF